MRSVSVKPWWFHLEIKDWYLNIEFGEIIYKISIRFNAIRVDHYVVIWSFIGNLIDLRLGGYTFMLFFIFLFFIFNIGIKQCGIRCSCFLCWISYRVKRITFPSLSVFMLFRAKGFSSHFPLSTASFQVLLMQDRATMLIFNGWDKKGINYE